MKISSVSRSLLLALLVIPWVMLSQLSPAQAADPLKIVLPAVSDRSGYNLPELNAALQNRLRSQFRFPKYEIISTAALAITPDRNTLEKITNDKAADGAVVVEINNLRNRSWTANDESFEETSLTLKLSYFDKKTGQYGQIKANRSVTQLMSIYSGSIPLTMESLEELLNRLDSVFPRQFSGIRY